MVKGFIKLAFVVMTALCLTIVYEENAVANEELPLLFVTDHNREIELKIASFLEKKGLNVERKVFRNDTDNIYIWMRLGHSDNDDAVIDFSIYTSVSATNNNVVNERVVRIIGLPQYEGVKNIKNKNEVLDFINKWSNQYWSPPTVFLDQDNDLRFEWPINIPGINVPVHCEQVYDAVFRILNSWVRMLDEMKKQKLI